jgi:hypothetical protein
MTATPARPTLTGNNNEYGDPIAQTGSGTILTEPHLVVLQAAMASNHRPHLTFGSFPEQVSELQRDGLLTTGETPRLTDHGREALVLTGWM